MDIVSHGSTAQHMQLINERIVRLEHAFRESAEQFVTETARLNNAGQLELPDLVERYSFLRAQYETAGRHGFSLLWEGAGLPKNGAMAHRAKWTVPGCGYWANVYPSPGEYPPHAVAYLLFDHAGEVIYVGSSGSLSQRLRTHWREGKRFVRWQAWYAPDRKAAYDLEDRLLKAHLPVLNTKAGA